MQGGIYKVHEDSQCIENKSTPRNWSAPKEYSKESALIKGKARITRQLWGAGTPHSLRRRGRAYTTGFNPAPKDDYTRPLSISQDGVWPLCVFWKHCVGHFQCLHGVFLVFLQSLGAGLPPLLAAEDKQHTKRQAKAASVLGRLFPRHKRGGKGSVHWTKEGKKEHVLVTTE